MIDTHPPHADLTRAPMAVYLAAHLAHTLGALVTVIAHGRPDRAAPTTVTVHRPPLVAVELLIGAGFVWQPACAFGYDGDVPAFTTCPCWTWVAPDCLGPFELWAWT